MLSRVQIKNTKPGRLVPECFINGNKVPYIISADFHSSVDEVPEFIFCTAGIPDIDAMGAVTINPTPTNLQEACRIVTNALLKHEDFYNAFISSVQSAITEAPEETWSNELAERIVKRISGEE